MYPPPPPLLLLLALCMDGRRGRRSRSPRRSQEEVQALAREFDRLQGQRCLSPASGRNFITNRSSRSSGGGPRLELPERGFELQWVTSGSSRGRTRTRFPTESQGECMCGRGASSWCPNHGWRCRIRCNSPCNQWFGEQWLPLHGRIVHRGAVAVRGDGVLVPAGPPFGNQPPHPGHANPGREGLTGRRTGSR